MIPLRDNIPSRRFPVINGLLILANVVVFLFEISLGDARLEQFIMTYGLIPGRITADPSGSWMTIFTSTFLHGGWLHLISNMLALFIFGDNIEDRMGHITYLAFYMAGGLAAGLMHIFTNLGSPIPTVGASGAIAAILGAYLILYPRARVLTIIPIFFFIQVVHIPAPIYLIFWFVSQLFNGAAEIASNTYQEGGVAWWAHIGGFVFGALVALLFFRRRTTRPQSVWDQPEVIGRNTYRDNDPYR